MDTVSERNSTVKEESDKEYTGAYYLHGKPEILVGKSNSLRHPVWEGFRKTGFVWMRCNCSTLFGLFS